VGSGFSRIREDQKHNGFRVRVARGPVTERDPDIAFRDELQRALGSAYVLERELGGGAMSRVFVARDTALERRIVVKVLPREMAAAVNVERFRREIQLAASLLHPHIIPLLSAGDASGLPYYTMPFVDGDALSRPRAGVRRAAFSVPAPAREDRPARGARPLWLRNRGAIEQAVTRTLRVRTATAYSPPPMADSLRLLKIRLKPDPTYGQQPTAYGPRPCPP
jgi:hypothetical protein